MPKSSSDNKINIQVRPLTESVLVVEEEKKESVERQGFLIKLHTMKGSILLPLHGVVLFSGEKSLSTKVEINETRWRISHGKFTADITTEFCGKKTLKLRAQEVADAALEKILQREPIYDSKLLHGDG